MHIFLSILYWTGIVLLVILGIIILLAALILFVPVRYKAHVKSDGKHLSVYASVTWLLHFLRFRFRYEDSTSDTQLKIAWFTLIGKKDKKTSGADEVYEEPDTIYSDQISGEQTEYEQYGIPDDLTADFEEAVGSDDEPDEAKELYEAAKKQPTQTSARDIRKKASKAVKNEKKRRKKGLENEDIFAEKEGKLTFLGRIRSIIESIRENANLASEVKAAYDEVKEYIFKVIRHILPRKVKGFIRFGFEDPSMTGKVCAVIGVLYPVIPEKLDIDPDFNNKIFEADVNVSGRITVFILLLNALRILLNKKVRALIRRFRRKKQGNKSRRSDPAFG